MTQNIQNFEKTFGEAFDHAYQALTSGVTIAQTQDIDPKKIEALYALGYNYYNQKDFPKAEEIFAFAHRLDSLNPKIIKGLAAARKMQKKYQQALQDYALAGLVDMEDPVASFHAAECFFALGQYQSCGEALDAAYGLAQMSEDHHALVEQIKKMKTNLKRYSQHD